MNEDLDRMRHEYEDRKCRFAGLNLYTFTNPASLFAIQVRQRIMSEILVKYGLSGLENETILEIGCGRGDVLAELLQLKANPKKLFGIDFLYDRLIDAQIHLPASQIVNADGQNLPFLDSKFNLILQFTAFSSILDDRVKHNMASEMVRVLKQNGLIIWYDFWLNPTNKQTKGIKKKEIKILFQGCTCDFNKITLAPPITRRLVNVSWIFCMILEKLKIFNTHYFVAIKKNVK